MRPTKKKKESVIEFSSKARIFFFGIIEHKWIGQNKTRNESKEGFQSWKRGIKKKEKLK